MTNTNDASARTARPRRLRFSLQEKIAQRIADHLMRYRSFSLPRFGAFSIAQIRAALDVGRRR
jgi:hypothetical protein